MPRSDGRLIAWKYLPISAHALNLDLLLAPQLVSDGLDVVGANSLQPDFLNDSRRLVDQRMLGGLDDLDRAVRPIYLPDVGWIGTALRSTSACSSWSVTS
jgi:hypothetical protein